MRTYIIRPERTSITLGFWAFALLLGAWSLVLCQAQTLPARQERNAQVADLIGIPADAQAAFDTALDDVKKAIVGGEKTAIDASIRELAEQLAVSRESPAAVERRLGAIKIPTYASYAEGNDPAFTKAVERQRINMLLLQKAQGASNPADAALFMKATLLLGTTSEPICGQSFLRAFNDKFDEYAKIADLTQEQAKRLRDFIQDVSAREQSFSAKLSPALYGRDLLIATKEGAVFDADIVNAILAYFDAAWDAAGVERDLRFIAIQELWTLRNLASRRQDAAFQARIDQLLAKWKGGVGDDKTVARWLDEAGRENVKVEVPPHFVGFKPDHPTIINLQQALKNYKSLQPDSPKPFAAGAGNVAESAGLAR